jgi:acetyltransferase-like isoleucine patch superfamily enzyme
VSPPVRKLGYVHGPRVMSRLRKWWVLLRHRHATVRFTEPVYLGPGFSLHIPEDGTFICGPCVEFRRNFRAEVSSGGRIEIGAHTVFTYDVLMQCSTRITIGRGCLFGQSTFIVDGNHRFKDVDKPILAQGYDFREITIGDDVGVMTKCTIINDLGDRTFVGANSVVTKPIPPYSVAAGVPAKVIDSFAPTPSETP